MNREDWRELDAAVADALEIDPAARDAFLRERLQREDLIHEAASLLAYSDTPGDPTEGTASLLRDSIQSPHSQWIGRRIGAYRITALAGEGGMGVVWSAERDDGQFQRCVAVKFLSTAFPSPSSLDRFLRERDILARLDHPHIGRLLDASVTEERQPYLVMEWIDGLRIDDYCRQRQLAIADILRLFLQVLDAVEYAHRRLVIHRDIKSANILVTADGQAKLLDFGIAQWTDPDSLHDRTSPLTRILTPEYASPEHLRGEPVTTSTDVYSLGIVLYELLAGHRPVSCEGKSLAQILQDAGRTVPPPHIHPDLDAIVLKALRPEPADRYGSASDFAADLDRFLTGRPIAARAPSTLYVAAKFVRRHRLAVAGASLGMILVAGSAVIANRQRIQAERRFSQLRQLADDVIFEFQDKISLLPGALDVRRRMVARSIEYLDSLSADARQDPTLLLDVAKGYDRLAIVQGKPSVANLGDFGGALASIRKSRAALETLVQLRPADFDAACTLGDVIFEMGNIQERVREEDARRTYVEGVRYWENLAQRYPDRERALHGLANAMFYKRDLERALTLYRQLAAQYPQRPDYLRSEALLSRSIASNDSVPRERARQLLDRAIEIDRARVAALSVDRMARLDLSFDLSTLGTWYENGNEVRAALAVFTEVLDIRERLVGEDARDEQARDRLLFILCEMGKLNAELNIWAESGRYYARAVTLGDQIAQASSFPDHQFDDLRKKADAGLAQARKRTGALP